MRAVEKRLRDRIRALESELQEVKDDRDKFRDFLVSELKKQLQVLGEKQHWTPASIIERITRFFQTVKYWGWW